MDYQLYGRIPIRKISPWNLVDCPLRSQTPFVTDDVPMKFCASWGFPPCFITGWYIPSVQRSTPPHPPESHDFQGSASSFAVARTSGSSPSSSWGHGGKGPRPSGHSLEIIPLLWLETQNWLVVDLPLWKTWTSVGMIIPNTYIYIWKNKSHVPVTTKQKRKWNVFSSLGRSSCDVAKPRRDITDITSKGCVCVGQHGKPPSLTLAQILNVKYEYDETLQSSPRAMGNPHCHGNFCLWGLLCRSLAVQQTDHLLIGKKHRWQKRYWNKTSYTIVH